MPKWLWDEYNVYEHVTEAHMDHSNAENEIHINFMIDY